MSSRTALVVAVGGALGTALRLAVAALPPAGVWPWGTLAVNLAGAFLLGLLVGRVRRPSVLAGVGTGVLGAATTFSALAVETVGLAGDGRPALAVLYATGSVIAGLALASLAVRR